jgi:Fe-S cluster assembly protein SufD
MITDKLTATHQFLEELSKHAGKVSFMPASEIGLALQYLEEKGIPNNKHEDYRYCNIEAILRKEFKTISGKEIDLTIPDLKQNYTIRSAYNIYVFNGKLHSDPHDFPEGVSILPINNASKERLHNHLTKYAPSNSDVLIALNTAYADRGFFLHINAIVKTPIIIHHINSSDGNLLFNIRNLVIVEKNANANVVEFFHPTDNKSFCNRVTEIFVGQHAYCNHTLVQNAGEKNYSVNATKVHQKTYSNYTNSCFTFSGALVRNNLSTAIDAEFAEANLFGLFFTKSNQLVDNHTLVDHLKPNCQSNELYKGIVGGKSTAVFNGQIFVEKDAQKTNAYQSSKNILLSDDATINAKPELEIYANDVKCSHGTSTGKVDENALFYLKARGIGEESARKLLLQAFAHEVIDQLKSETIKEKVSELFEQSLQD